MLTVKLDSTYPSQGFNSWEALAMEVSCRAWVVVVVVTPSCCSRREVCPRFKRWGLSIIQDTTSGAEPSLFM
jgi:hypothetical protein